MATKKASKKTRAQKQATTQSRVKGTIKRTMKQKSLACEIEFSFFAPLAKAVHIAGTFNSWNQAYGTLRSSKKGVWKTVVSLQPGKYEYRFCIDGNWENDQKEVELVDNGMGSCNNVITVT